MSDIVNKIFEHVPPHDQPGTTIKALAAAAGIPYGAADMHVKQMERRGMVWKLDAPPREGIGARGYVYVRADTSGYSHLMEPWEAELVKVVEENPDRMCFCAWFVHEKGYLDQLMGLTEWYPNRHEPFTHFHVVWSIRLANYLSVPGCFLHGTKDKDDALEVEKFTDQESSCDWLLTKGVALKRKGLLPDGRQIPVCKEELDAYKQADVRALIEAETPEHAEVVAAFLCGHPKSPENSKKKSGAGMICRECFEANRRQWRARVKAADKPVDVKKYDAVEERIQRIDVS